MGWSIPSYPGRHPTMPMDPSTLVVPPLYDNAPQPHPNQVQLVDNSQTAPEGQTPYGRLCGAELLDSATGTNQRM